MIRYKMGTTLAPTTLVRDLIEPRFVILLQYFPEDMTIEELYYFDIEDLVAAVPRERRIEMRIFCHTQLLPYLYEVDPSDEESDQENSTDDS